MGRHGGGSHSGGGHSGGSHFSPHHHHHHHTTVYMGPSAWRYRTRRNPFACFTCCCCCFLILAIVLISTLGPRSLSDDVEISTFEQILYTPNTEWYDEFNLNTPEVNLQVFKFARPPPLSQTRIPINRQYNLNVDAGHFEYWVFHLNQLSQVTLSFNIDFGKNVYFYLIQGQNNFKQWEANSQSESGVIKKIYGSAYSNFVFNVREDDFYYFVWDNSQSWDMVTGRASFFMLLIQYDLSNPIDSCHYLHSCSFTLKQGSSECVLVNGLDDGYSDDVYRYHYSLSARTDHYWAIFGSVFASLCCCCFILGALLLVYLKRRRIDESKAPLTGSAQPPPEYTPSYPAYNPGFSPVPPSSVPPPSVPPPPYSYPSYPPSAYQPSPYPPTGTSIPPTNPPYYS